MSVNVFLSSISILNIPTYWLYFLSLFRRQRSSRPEVFLGKGVLKICSKFTREQPCQSVYWNHTSAWVFSSNLLHISRTPFLKNTSGWLLLKTAVHVFYKEGYSQKFTEATCGSHLLTESPVNKFLLETLTLLERGSHTEKIKYRLTQFKQFLIFFDMWTFFFKHVSIEIKG